MYDTKFGKLLCAKIQAESISRLGKNNAEFLFNQKYGFIQMDFTALDSTKVQIQLEKVTDS